MSPERHISSLPHPKHCLRVMFGIFIFGLLSTSSLLAQDHLYLEKPPFKRKKVEIGVKVKVKIKGGSRMQGFHFQGAKGDSLYLSGSAYHIEGFEKFWVQRPRNTLNRLKMLSKGGSTFVILFPPLMLLDVLNRGTKFERSDWHRIRFSIATGISLMALSKRLEWKRYKIGEKWFLKVRPPVENSVLPDLGGQPQSPIEDQ